MRYVALAGAKLKILKYRPASERTKEPALYNAGSFVLLWTTCAVHCVASVKQWTHGESDPNLLHAMVA